MIHVFVDYEMNEIPRDKKAQWEICKREIIEIGAVMLDEQGEIMSEYSQYVKPQFGSITQYYTRLTGITNEMVQDSPFFQEAMEQFYDWLGESPVTMYSWSDSDSNQLRREATLKSMMDLRMTSLLENWVDFQKRFRKLL